MARNAGMDGSHTGSHPGNHTGGHRETSSQKSSGQRAEAQHAQAAFDFLPQEMRHRLRFNDVLQAGRADLRNQSRLVDRQIVGIGSRIAAARLREILRPAHEWAQPALGMPAPDTNVPESAAEKTHNLEQGAMITQTELTSPAASNAAELAQQREVLREIGTALFYFRDEDETPPQTAQQLQRLHPRPLPARYYGAPPQQAGGAAAPPARISVAPPPRVSVAWVSPHERKIA